MSDNRRHTRTMEFEVSDAPALMRAFSIAACTAMMCGHKGAQARLDRYKKLMAEFVPAEAKLFDEEVWCEIGIALVNAKTFRVALTQAGWHRHHWVHDGKLTVYVDDVRFDTQGIETYRPGAPEIEAIYKVLTDLAPIDCVGTMEGQEVEIV